MRRNTFPPAKPIGRQIAGYRSLLAGRVDKRYAPVKRFQRLYDTVIGDLGGPDTVSEAQRQLAKRAAALATQCEQMEQKMLLDDYLDIKEYTTVSNALRRILATLGIKKAVKEVTLKPWEYLASRDASTADDEEEDEDEDEEDA